jgi:uncharacterized membrane protein
LSFPYAIAGVALAALFGNRIIATVIGVWLQIPPLGLLAELIALDVVQIPMFYWLYDNSERLLSRLPTRISRFFQRKPKSAERGRWAGRLGHLGVGLLTALPTFGGGMWSGVFLAYGLKLDRRLSYLTLTLGSAVSYLVIYWIADTLVSAIRYFGT